MLQGLRGQAQARGGLRAAPGRCHQPVPSPPPARVWHGLPPPPPARNAESLRVQMPGAPGETSEFQQAEETHWMLLVFQAFHTRSSLTQGPKVL